jgi:hypothetical protein
MRFVNVGYGNVVSMQRIVAIVSPESAPVRRLVQDGRDERKVIDATCGRKTRAVIITDTGLLILSPLQTETLAARMEDMK